MSRGHPRHKKRRAKVYGPTQRSYPREYSSGGVVADTAGPKRNFFEEAQLARDNWQDAYDTIQKILAHPTCSPEIKRLAAAYIKFAEESDGT